MTAMTNEPSCPRPSRSGAGLGAADTGTGWPAWLALIAALQERHFR
jgi:hypothetical protein